MPASRASSPNSRPCPPTPTPPIPTANVFCCSFTSPSPTTKADSLSSAPTVFSTSDWVTAAAPVTPTTGTYQWDATYSGDPNNNAQNLSSFLGKMLRIGVDPPFATGKEYAIPADNPFAGGGGLPEIYAYGLRNPWRFSFEPVTNRMFVADVGQDSFEEIDIMQKGGNYGWRIMEATHCFNPATGCDMTNKILPIFEYPHTDGIAVIGGYIYKGTAIPSLANKYIFADLTGKIWSLTEAPANTWTRGDLLATNLTLTSFGRDAAGELYLVDYNGNILKLVLQ